MSLAGEGRSPGQSHMLRLAAQADMSKREATAIINQVQPAVTKWKGHAADASVSQVSIRQVAQSLPQLP
jgi:hypothetical protein